jgi:hypothetical protein
MIVKIIKCSSENWWYHDKIGQLFRVKPFKTHPATRDISYGADMYIVTEDFKDFNSKLPWTRNILMEDCIDIQELREEKLKQLDII